VAGVHRAEGLYYQEIEEGEVWFSPARTVTTTDIVLFAGLTGDMNPLHVDHEYARQTPYGRPIAHGLLGLSLVAGLGSNWPRMQTVAFVRIVQWEFLKPVVAGDTVHVRTEVLAIEPRARGRRALVRWKRQLINQRDEVVQEGVTETLVEGRPTA